MFEFDNMSGLVAILAVLLVFGTPIIIVTAILIHKARRTQRIHQTVVAGRKGIADSPTALRRGGTPLHRHLRARRSAMRC